MPNCFRLTRKLEGGAMGDVVPLSVVDDEICEHMGVRPDAKYYFASWYDVIGLGIAMGKPLGSQELRDALVSDTHRKVLSFMEENYTSEAWVMR